MKASLNGRLSTNIVAVTKTDGRLTATSAGVNLKNQINELRSIEDISDVVETNVTDGATIIYNSTLDKYEIKPISFDTLPLDGGTF